MSWAEIMEMREELSDIRKRVGGSAVHLGKDYAPRSVDDDIREVRIEISSLKSAIEALQKNLSDLQTLNVSANAIAETTVNEVVQELKTATDELDTTLKKVKK